MKNDTIELPDGYNGHKIKFFAEPIVRESNLVKLRCAEPGLTHMIAWKHERDLLARSQGSVWVPNVKP